MTTIPANDLVNVNPSVLSPGGIGLDVIGLVLTTSTRVPIGTVLSLGSATAVQNYFGGASIEAQIAQGGTNYGTGYFGGFDGSNKKPASILFAQYNQAAVAAYLRGGNISALTLTQLQAISGSLNVTVDGFPRNAASVNLASATSFSNAASIIQTALNAADPVEATFTASIGATFTGSQSGTNLTTSAVVGLISVGDTISGTGVAAGTTIVSQTSGTPGGAGVYVTSVSGTASAASCTASSNVLDVTNVVSGSIQPGEYLVGTGVTSVAVLARIGGTTGGVGTYQIAGSPQAVASESMTTQGIPVAVTFDSVSGAFTIASGLTGVGSTIGFATGTAAAPLLLTSATGAVTSQGAAPAVPATFMNALVANNSNWATFMTTFDPDNGSGSAVKQAFAAWKNSQNNRFAYVCFDLDASPTTAMPATGSLGYILSNNNDSGTCLLEGDPAQGWNLNYGVALAAMVCGSAASIDFTQTNGRITFAFKQQPGMLATTANQTIAHNLGGVPQVANSRGNGYSFYGAYGTANANFTWLQRGFVTGPFLWLDSYINQIWLNNAFQVDLLVLQKNSLSIPYDIAGYALMETALSDTIVQALNFGIFAPGTISASQAAAVNQAAGANIAATLQTQGYYLQVLPAAPTARSQRISPPATFWYIDRGSVQAINLNSIALS